MFNWVLIILVTTAAVSTAAEQTTASSTHGESLFPPIKNPHSAASATGEKKPSPPASESSFITQMTPSPPTKPPSHASASGTLNRRALSISSTKSSNTDSTSSISTISTGSIHTNSTQTLNSDSAHGARPNSPASITRSLSNPVLVLDDNKQIDAFYNELDLQGLEGTKRDEISGLALVFIKPHMTPFEIKAIIRSISRIDEDQQETVEMTAEMLCQTIEKDDDGITKKITGHMIAQFIDDIASVSVGGGSDRKNALKYAVKFCSLYPTQKYKTMKHIGKLMRVIADVTNNPMWAVKLAEPFITQYMTFEQIAEFIQVIGEIPENRRKEGNLWINDRIDAVKRAVEFIQKNNISNNAEIAVIRKIGAITPRKREDSLNEAIRMHKITDIGGVRVIDFIREYD